MDATLIALCCDDRLHIRYVISASGATWEPYQAYCQGDIAPWLDWLNSNMPAPDGSAWKATKQNTAAVEAGAAHMIAAVGALLAVECHIRMMALDAENFDHDDNKKRSRVLRCGFGGFGRPAP